MEVSSGKTTLANAMEDFCSVKIRRSVLNKNLLKYLPKHDGNITYTSSVRTFLGASLMTVLFAEPWLRHFAYKVTVVLLFLLLPINWPGLIVPGTESVPCLEINFFTPLCVEWYCLVSLLFSLTSSKQKLLGLRNWGQKASWGNISKQMLALSPSVA